MKQLFGKNWLLATTASLQMLLLLIVAGIGLSLTVQLTESVKLVHAGLGVLAGLFTLATVYQAYRQQLTPSVVGSAGAAVGFTLLAGLSGKLAETSYATGLLLMKASAAGALITSAVVLFLLYRSHNQKS